MRCVMLTILLLSNDANACDRRRAAPDSIYLQPLR